LETEHSKEDVEICVSDETKTRGPFYKYFIILPAGKTKGKEGKIYRKPINTTNEYNTQKIYYGLKKGGPF